MSAATASSTETIFVRLLDEGVEVWRPVNACPLGHGVYRLSDASSPSEEAWEFGPGAVVRAGTRNGSEGPMLVALALADERRAG